MGLLERLMERVLDEATASRRAESARRAALRGQIITELRNYATAIERMRVSYLRVRDLLASTGDIEDIKAEASEAHPVYEPGVLFHAPHHDMLAYDLLHEVAPDTADRMRLIEFASHLQEEFLEGLWQTRSAAKDEAKSLDLAWATVRPLLDDVLELEALVYLREFRHELRKMIQGADTVIAMYVTGSPPPKHEQIRIEAIRSIEQLVVFADAWLAHVGGVRRNMAT